MSEFRAISATLNQHHRAAGSRVGLNGKDEGFHRFSLSRKKGVNPSVFDLTQEDDVTISPLEAPVEDLPRRWQ